MKLFMGVQLSGNKKRNIYVHTLYVCMYVTVNYKKESRRVLFNRLSINKGSVSPPDVGWDVLFCCLPAKSGRI